MICPRCNTQLVLSSTHNIEIDYCPNCRGVWLDKGELEKIIEREDSAHSLCFGNDPHFKNHNEHDHHHNENHHDNHHTYGHHSNRKKGFFSELFDF